MNGLGLKSYKQTLYIIMNIFTITSLYYFSNAALVCAKHPSSTAQEIGRCYYYPHFTDGETKAKNRFNTNNTGHTDDKSQSQDLNQT